MTGSLGVVGSERPNDSCVLSLFGTIRAITPRFWMALGMLDKIAARDQKEDRRMRIFQCLLLTIFLGFSMTSLTQAVAQEETTDQRIKAILAQHRLITSLREVEAMSRELYFEQSFILLYVHGDRKEWIGSRNHPPRMLTEAVDSRFVPPLKRFRARVDRLQLQDTQKSLVFDALDSIDSTIAAGYDIAAEIEQENVFAATTIFHERSLPAFKSAWRNLYTVVFELERDVPRR